MNKIPDASEQEIKNAIMDFLTLKHITFALVKTTGNIIYKKGKIIFGKSKRDLKGQPDLIFAYHGKAVACEIKTRTGRVDEDQVNWLSRWQDPASSGYSFIARSVTDVEEALETLDRL